MRVLAILTGAALMTAAGFSAVNAQPNPIQGTPNSLFPDAAPNEIQFINGVPCRTVLVQGTNMRVPVKCAGQVATGTFDPGSTGSIRVEEGGRVMSGRAISGTPDSLFPYAASNEIRIINGVPCRTILVDDTNIRVPVECAR